MRTLALKPNETKIEFPKGVEVTPCRTISQSRLTFDSHGATRTVHTYPVRFCGKVQKSITGHDGHYYTGKRHGINQVGATRYTVYCNGREF